MAQNIAVKPNEKGGPFIFVSYSHTISGRAEAVIRALQAKGYRVWFDYGLTPGSSYNDVIAKYITECEVFLCLLSQGYYESTYCKQEFLFAKEECKKPIIPVYVGKLDEIKASLPPGILMWLTGVHSIELRDTDNFIRQIESSGLVSKCKSTKPGPTAGTPQGTKPRPMTGTPQGTKPRPTTGTTQGTKPQNSYWNTQGTQPGTGGSSSGQAARGGKPKGQKKESGMAAAVIAVLALVVCIIAGMFLIRRSKNENTYAEAVQMMQSGDYEGAVSAFKALGDYKDSRDLLTSIRADYEISQCADAQVGDTVVFGTYEQDDKTDNGSEDIEWFVLAKEEDRVLLLSRYALEGQPFNADSTDTTWETCSLRKWLNSDFLTTAFDQNEQQKIAETVCKAETSDFVSDDEIEINLGNDTVDRVFLLSDVEVHEYLSDDMFLCEHTAYTRRKCAQTVDGYALWMLRMPCETVTDSIGLFIDLNVITDETYAVRPAMWLDLSAE